jgi:hypothetical protein
MKKFICTVCGAEWYSAASSDKFCEKCAGRLVEIKLDNKKSK